MNRIQLTGAIYIVLAAAGIVLYGLLLSGFPLAVLKTTAFLAVAGFLVILGWVGFVMLKTPETKTKDE